MNTKKTLISLVTLGTLVTAIPVSAQTTDVTASTEVSASINTPTTNSKPGVLNKATNAVRAAGAASTTIKAKISAATTKSKDRGDQEIDRRIKGLTDLTTKVQAMKHITDAQKTSIESVIQNQITILQALKAKIDADTDEATLKEDIKSITESYRIYALILPQIQILAAADRLDTLADSFAQVSAKIQTQLVNATTTTSANITASLTDINAKIADAKVQANTAVSTVGALSPDNGDKTKMASNTAALKDARSKIKTGNQDIVAARKDIDTIMKVLRPKGAVKANVTASSTANVKSQQ